MQKGKLTWKGEEERRYYIKQRILGLILVIIGIIGPFLFDGDATFFRCAMLPLGLYLIFTKQKATMF